MRRRKRDSVRTSSRRRVEILKGSQEKINCSPRSPFFLPSFSSFPKTQRVRITLALHWAISLKPHARGSPTFAPTYFCVCVCNLLVHLFFGESRPVRPIHSQGENYITPRRCATFTFAFRLFVVHVSSACLSLLRYLPPLCLFSGNSCCPLSSGTSRCSVSPYPRYRVCMILPLVARTDLCQITTIWSETKMLWTRDSSQQPNCQQPTKTEHDLGRETRARCGPGALGSVSAGMFV